MTREAMTREELRAWAADGERCAKSAIEREGARDVLGYAYRACGLEIPRLLDALAAADRRIADAENRVALAQTIQCHHHEREHDELIKATREIERLHAARTDAADLRDRLKTLTAGWRGRAAAKRSCGFQSIGNFIDCCADELLKVLEEK